jgi:hypothetical protein
MNNRIKKRKEKKRKEKKREEKKRETCTKPKVRKMKSLLKPTDGVQGRASLKAAPLSPAFGLNTWKWSPWAQVLTLRPSARGATVPVICSLDLRFAIDCHHQV